MHTLPSSTKFFIAFFVSIISIKLAAQGNEPLLNNLNTIKNRSLPCDKNPKIICPPNLTLCPGADTSTNGTGFAKGLPGGPNCSLPIIAYTTRIFNVGACPGEKSISRIWTAVDPIDPSLRTFCNQVISYEDKVGPVFHNCNRDTSILSNDRCFALFNWATPFVTDDCSNFSVKSSLPNGSVFPEGTSTISFTATDACGNVTTCSFKLTVIENCCNKPPIITCPNDYTGCLKNADPSITGKPVVTSGSPLCLTPILSYIDDTILNKTCSLSIIRKWTATDPNNFNLNTSCTQKISFSDTIPPTIICPANITVKSDPDCTGMVSWLDPVTNDNCSSVNLSSSHHSGSKFNIGNTTVTYSASDACGNTMTCQFTITVEADCCEKPPVVICPNDFKACPQGIDPLVTGRASALKGSKLCSTPILNYKDEELFNSACSLKVIRKWTAIDTLTKFEASCNQMIELKDSESPSITCPSNLIAKTDSNCMAIVKWNDPTTSDNCSVVTLTSTHQSGASFNSGITTVIYTASDACGNSKTCQFTVSVEANCCNKPPVVSCPANFIGCPQGIDPSVTGRASALKGNKFCTTPILQYLDDTLYYKACSLNVNRKWIGTDTFTKLTVFCIQSIDLKDTQSPTINNLNDITVPSGLDCKAIVNWPAPTASDNCSNSTISSSHASGSSFPLGTTKVTITANDACGNFNTLSFNVIVTDQCCDLPPLMTCPANYQGCPNSSTLPIITGSPNVNPGISRCRPALVSYNDQILFNNSCSTYIRRTWLAVDSIKSNLRSECVQIIELKDTIKPIVTCPNDIEVLSNKDCVAIVEWDVHTSDNCGNVHISSSHESGAELPVGKRTIYYTVFDDCGNSSGCNFQISVLDNCCLLPPKISCQNVTTCPGSKDPARLGTPTVIKGNKGCKEPILTYTDHILVNGQCSLLIDRKWLAVDPDSAALRDSCIQRIEMIDIDPPIIKNCPTDIVIAPNSNCEAFPTWIEPTADDACRLISFDKSHSSGSKFTVGTTKVEFIATDACGNVSKCSFNVTVTNECCNIPPSISCPPDFFGCPSSSLDPINTGFATAQKGHSLCSTPMVSYSDKIISSGSCIGATSILRTWTAVEPMNANLFSTCIQKITLKDTIPPVIVVPSNMVIDAKGKCEIPVSWTPATATDNCNLVSLVSNKINGALLKGGITKVVYTATDGCGNTSTASFTITIVGTTIQLDCPNDTIVYRTNTGANGVAVDWNLPTAKYCNSCIDTLPGFIYMGEFGGNRYFCSLSPAKWFDAKINCSLLGGKLAVIKNKQENNFISSKLMNQVAWIGASDERVEGGFEWVDGSPFLYSNWATGRPNSSNPFNDYVELSPNGTWSDQSGNQSKEFICQIPCYSLRQIEGQANGSTLPCGTHKISYEASKDGSSDTCSFMVKVDCDSISKYCYNKALNTGIMWINQVTVANIDNVSGDNGGYAYFNNPCGNLKNNQLYNLCVVPGFSNNLYTVYWKVWIDFSNDGFFQSNELILLGSGNSGLCGKFTLPANYFVGKVRMRVMMSYGNYPATACSTILYGEVEDYCINLTQSGTLVSEESMSNYPIILNCAKDCDKKSSVLNIGDNLISRNLEPIFSIIPNPAKDEIRIISSSKDIKSFNIYDINGKLVWRKFSSITNQEILDVSKWSEGVYYIIVEYSNEKQSSEKILIQR